MITRRIRFAFVGACLIVTGALLSAQVSTVRITNLYDSGTAAPGAKSDWGFACLLEGGGHTVLFDTGGRAEVLRQNLSALKIDPTRIQAVVLSHDHDDHTLGLAALPGGAGLPVYTGAHADLSPEALAALKRIGARRVVVGPGQLVDVFPGFRVSGEIHAAGAYEEALIVDTPNGLIVVVGCSHPGIVLMLRQIAAATKRPIYTVIGGFHLLQTPAAEVKQIVADFRKLGVAWVGPTHCTGEEATRLFREAYGDHLIPGGVGTVVNVAKTVRVGR